MSIALERSMALTSRSFLNGDWNTIQTDLEHPFVIGDAPVVTWQRRGNGLLDYQRGI